MKIMRSLLYFCLVGFAWSIEVTVFPPAQPEVVCRGNSVFAIAQPLENVHANYSLQLCESWDCVQTNLWKNICLFGGHIQSKPMECCVANYSESDYHFYFPTMAVRVVVETSHERNASVSEMRIFSFPTCPKFEVQAPKIQSESGRHEVILTLKLPKEWQPFSHFKNPFIVLEYFERDSASMMKTLHQLVPIDSDEMNMKLTGMKTFTEYTVILDVSSSSDPESIEFTKVNLTVRTSEAEPDYVARIDYQRITVESTKDELYKVTLYWNLPESGSLNGDFKNFELQIKQHDKGSWQEPIFIQEMSRISYSFVKLHPRLKYEARLRVNNQHYAGNYSSVFLGPYGVDIGIDAHTNTNMLVMKIFAGLLAVGVVATLCCIILGHRKMERMQSADTLQLSPDHDVGTGHGYETVSCDNKYFSVVQVPSEEQEKNHLPVDV